MKKSGPKNTDKSKPIILSPDEEGEPKHMIDLIKATNPRTTHNMPNISTILDVTVFVDGVDDDVVVGSVVPLVVVVSLVPLVPLVVVVSLVVVVPVVVIIYFHYIFIIHFYYHYFILFFLCLIYKDNDYSDSTKNVWRSSPT